jgi:hypothetical protein
MNSSILRKFLPVLMGSVFAAVSLRRLARSNSKDQTLLSSGAMMLASLTSAPTLAA